MGIPERVVNLSFRSTVAADLAFSSDMDVRNSIFAAIYGLLLYSFLALRKEVTAKNRNKRATATARTISQRATSRVQARRAELSQPRARTAKTAPVAS
jgi:hypothetical protein